MPTKNFYDVLAQRGLVAQATDENPRQRFEQPITAYNGFDATADSLHIGHLVPLLCLAQLQRCGHRPVVLLGGATTLVGDPTDRLDSRPMLSRDVIEQNARRIEEQVQRILRFDDTDSGAILVNNIDWIGPLNWLELLRDIGAHFSVNWMLKLDSVRSRLEAGGLTFLEFNYMVLQAYDFVHLHRTYECTIQTGAQDQWGNIVAGVELARRMDGASLGGLTYPLLLKSDGSKFGKSSSGTVWLSAERTPPYELYQYLRNTPDADVTRCLAMLTLLPADELRRLGELSTGQINEAKEILAYEVTRLIHGDAEAHSARDSSRRAFGADRDFDGDAIPHTIIRTTELSDLRAMMVRAGLSPSNSDAKKLIQGGAVRLGNEQVTDIRRIITGQDVTEGHILIRIGKKRVFRFDIED